jgi:hypothetical protein
MRKIIFLLTGIILSISGYSQVTADIGFWGGGAGYLGDIEENTLTQMSVPFLGAFFRYNFHQRASARLMFMSGPVEATGAIQNYNWIFKKNVNELTLQAEINYLKYMIGNRKASFTPYLTAGLGVMYFTYYRRPHEVGVFNPHHLIGFADGEEGEISTVLPFGMGFKFNIGSRVGVGVEYQMRKIFNDRLDDLDDPLAHYNDEGALIKYTDFIHNNDWTGYLGLYLTYKIYIGSRPCPAYDSINQK